MTEPRSSTTSPHSGDLGDWGAAGDSSPAGTPVILGLGCNLGDRISRLRDAVAALTRPVPGLPRTEPPLRGAFASGVYESPALLPENAPEDWDLPFLNLAVAGTTRLSPEDLLTAIKRVESHLGRKPRGRWAPREIDIDILAYGTSAARLQTPLGELKLPHPGLAERAFAIRPFAELWPQWRHPELGTTALALADRFAEDGRFAEDKEDKSGTFRNDIRPSIFLMPRLMAVLNVTPDSFSDGGKFFDAPEVALESARRYYGQGTQILDIGAESTRPGAAAVSPDEEWKRLDPVLRGLVHWKRELAAEAIRRASARDGLQPATPPSQDFLPILSVDTRHARTAERALEAGADWINDVTGFSDPRMRSAVRDSGAPLVLMHSLGIPPSREQVLPRDRDPMDGLLDFLRARLGELERDGIGPSRVIFDPGIGFGKTAQQSMSILAQAERLHELGTPILIGHSRKSYLNLITERPFAERDPETAALSACLAGAGIEYLRVHDSELHQRTLAPAAELLHERHRARFDRQAKGLTK